MHLLFVIIREPLSTTSTDVGFGTCMNVHVIHEFGSWHKFHPITIKGTYLHRCFCRCPYSGIMCHMSFQSLLHSKLFPTCGEKVGNCIFQLYAVETYLLSQSICCNMCNGVFVAPNFLFVTFHVVLSFEGGALGFTCKSCHHNFCQ